MKKKRLTNTFSVRDYAGMLGFLLGVGAIIGFYSALPPANVGEWAMLVTSALAVGGLYYFLVGALAHLIMAVVHVTRNKEGLRVDWVVATLNLWLISAVVGVAAFGIEHPEKMLAALFFPYVYGIFFLQFALAALAGTRATDALVASLFHGAYFVLFALWALLEYATAARGFRWRVGVKRTILALLLLVAAFGMVQCALHV
jgi:hypothetical protein